MDKIFNFLKQSNQYKHLIGGFLVALCLLIVFMGHYLCAIYAVCIAASCLELKDKLRGCPWDWIDWFCTLIGGLLAVLLFWIYHLIF